MVETVTPFPNHILNSKQSALCMFCAAFGGVQDVKYIREAGIKDITLLDNDAEKVDLMRKSGDKVLIADAFTFLKSPPDKKYNIIVCDQWTNHDPLIHDTYFRTLYNMCSGYLILGVTGHYLSSQEEVSGEFYLRSRGKEHTGPIYWRVIDCRGNNPQDDTAK